MGNYSNLEELQKEFTELQDSFDALKRIHDSTNAAVKQLSEELERLKGHNAVLNAEKRQWDTEKANQQMIIQQTLTQSNDMSSRYLEENIKLREELRQLRGK